MIRKAKKEDAARMVYINVTSWKKTYKDIFPSSFLDSLNPYDEAIIEKYSKKIDEYIVYEEKGQVLGFARYGINKKGYSNDYAEIYALYVDNEYHGKRIGTKLVNDIIKRLKNKYKYLLISTIKENSANEFYQKIGGKKIGNCYFNLENKEYEENIYQFDIIKNEQ